MRKTTSSGSDEAKALLDQVGPALSRLRRRTLGSRRDLTRNLVLNLIDGAPGEMTVGRVAEELGVTQPVASRTVAACIKDGLVCRTASQQDGRRSLLELTEAGQAERFRLAAEQRRAFEAITASWNPDERLQFARFLLRYSQDNNAGLG